MIQMYMWRPKLPLSVSSLRWSFIWCGVREARTLDLRITRFSYETYALANCATQCWLLPNDSLTKACLFDGAWNPGYLHAKTGWVLVDQFNLQKWAMLWNSSWRKGSSKYILLDVSLLHREEYGHRCTQPLMGSTTSCRRRRSGWSSVALGYGGAMDAGPWRQEDSVFRYFFVFC